jgi:hypothetical protein
MVTASISCFCCAAYSQEPGLSPARVVFFGIFLIDNCFTYIYA